MQQCPQSYVQTHNDHALIPDVGRIIKKYDFALPIKSEKQKLAEVWYRNLLKIFKTLLNLEDLYMSIIHQNSKQINLIDI